jgi:hypothetical protein
LAANRAVAAPRDKKRISIPPVAIVIVLALAAGVAGFMYLNRAAKKAPTAPAPLSGDARTYIHNGFLPISNVDMQAHESYLQQQVVEITGKIGNTGNRVIANAQIYCVFLDSYNQVVLRERVSIVNRKLAPGDTQPFRLAFDNIPGSWNQAMPSIVIASIEFA